MPDASPAARGLVPALDGVRGVAILAVLAHQLCIDGYAGPRAVRLALLPFQAGWVGVQVFFVLSGFLITGILLDTRRAENAASSFYARRALRIFPLYYLLLLVTFVIAPRLVSPDAETIAQHRHQGWYWLYLVNVAPLFGGGAVRTLGHCWSLSVEEQFYLVWPLAVRLLDARGLARLCVGVAVAALLLRLGIRLAGADPELAYELTPARADALALGALGAVAVRRADWAAWAAPRLGRATAAAAAILAGIGVAGGGLARVNAVTQTAGYTALAVLSALVVVRVARVREGRLARWLSGPILRAYGRYSYAIYVMHLPLHLFVQREILAPRLPGLGPAAFLGVQAAYFVVGGGALLVLGAVSYRVIERPFLALKGRFAARFTPAAA